MTLDQKIHKLTGSPLRMCTADADQLARELPGTIIDRICKVVEKRINDQDELIANRLSQLSPEEREEWIKAWQTRE